MDAYNSILLNIYLVFCAFFDNAESMTGQRNIHQSKPCCLPHRFQAIVVPVASFSVDNRRLVRVTRDWDNRLQIQESILLLQDGSESVEYKYISDFQHMIQYISSKNGCRTQKIKSGMLEPCMPENATYLGKSYIGQYDSKADIDGWYFRRTDKNRNIEMTIAVTSDRCVPVMEHITGTLGEGEANTLVLFTNLTEAVEDKVFDLPAECFSLAPM